MDAPSRKKVEEKIDESEQRYRTLLNSIEQGFCVLKMLFDENDLPVDYHFLEVNPVFEAITGIPNDEALSGKTARALVPNLEDKWVEIYGKVALTGEPVRFTDGSEAMNRWFEVYACRVGGQKSRQVALIFNDITERKQSEQSLQESENKYRTLIEQASDGIHTYDLQGNFIETNSKLCEMLGYTREELLQLNVKNLIPAEDFAADPIHFDELLAGKTLLRERRLLCKDGTLLPVEISGKMVQDGVLQAIIRDVTERKRAEEALRNSENQLRLITDSIPLLISYVDREHRYRFVNRSYTEWFGKAREKVIGRHLSEILGDAAYQSILPEVEKVLSGEEVIFQRSVPYKSGERFIHVNYIPDFDAATGQVIGFNSFVQDISERKRAEVALRKSEEWLRSIFEASRDGILVEDDEQIIYVNKSYTHLFGYNNPEELIGRHVSVVISSEDLERMLNFGRNRARGKQPASVYEFKGQRKDGMLIDVEASVSTSNVGGHTYITTMVRDIAGRKLTEEKLRRSHEELELRVLERTKDLKKANKKLQAEIIERKQAEKERIKVLHQLVSVQEDERRRIARDLHDQLGQQLTVLRFKLEALRKMCVGTEDVFEQVGETQKVARRIDSNVDFLAWQMRPTMLDDLGIVAALDHYVRQWSTHFNISAEFNANRFGKIKLTPEAEIHFYRIVQEALNNVYKHAKAGNVNVSLEPRGDSTILIIEDDGIGFEPDKKILNKKGMKGKGLLGMHERAALIGGSLEIESARGKGTTIYVGVPVSNGKKGKKSE